MERSIEQPEEPRQSRHGSRSTTTRSSSTDSLLEHEDQLVIDILNSQATTSTVPVGSTIDDNEEHETTQASPLLSPLQVKFIIVLLVICNFLIANGVSLQGPFFPKEAGT